MMLLAHRLRKKVTVLAQIPFRADTLTVS